MSGYIGTQPVPQATQTRDSFTATANQTSFATSGYTPEFLDVFLNGVKLAASDYTATNGSDVVLASGAATGDILEVVAYTAFDTANVTGATNFTVTGAFTSQGIDDNGNATAITIDSSENVMLNTTNTSLQLSSSDEGFTYANNFTTVSRDGGTTAYFNRLSSDGDVVAFRKNGSTVGSIGAVSGRTFLNSQGGALSLRTAGSDRMQIDASYVYPQTDNSYDLGSSGNRFKDAYLSGGVNIYNGSTDSVDIRGTGSRCEIDNPDNNSVLLKTGGTTRVRIDANGLLFGSDTAAANALNDYEEGTFTLTWSGTGGTANTASTMSYVKVGSRVTISGNTSGGLPNATGLLELTGLPFAANDDSVGAMLYRSMSAPSGAHNLVIYIGSGQTKLQPYWASGSNYTRLDSSHFAANGNQDIYFSVTYFTNS
jgi:hypothetical protein